MRTRLALILALLASAAQATMYVHLPTQRLTDALPTWVDGVSNPDMDRCAQDGWRLLPARMDVPAGYRLNGFHASQDPANALQCVEDTPLVNLSDEAAAQAAAASNAAEVARNPVPFEKGIEVPVVVLTEANGAGWGVVADGDDLVTYQDHASPRPSDAVIAAAIASNKAARAQLRLDLRDVRLQTVTNLADCQALTATNFPAGGQRQTVNAIEGELVDLNRQLQALRKVVSALVKGEL